MASTILQNVQRGIILIQLMILALVCTFLTVKLIKRRIDLKPEKKEKYKPNVELAVESAAEKYRDSEVTEQQVQQAAVRDTVLNDEDTCVQRLMKKIVQLNVQFNPWLLGIMLSFVTGTSSAFSFSFYIIALVCCVLFNSFKVHRACVDHFLSRWAIEALFPISCILLLVNILVTGPSVMLYTLVQN